jgi:energy-coupling factor transporter ATP-binding protein EcfA2
LQARSYSASSFLLSNKNSAANASSSGSSKKNRVLGVQREGAPGLAVMTVAGRVLIGDLVEEIKKKLPSLRDVDSDNITLQLANVDASGKELLVTLNSMDTVDEALEKAKGRLPRAEEKLCLIVDVVAPLTPAAPVKPIGRSANPALLPERPVPIAIAETRFKDATGSPMHVVTLDKGYPFYLEDLALQKLKSWASGEVSADYADQKLVVFSGPIKCGKSTLLKLLPRLLSPDSRRKPVVMFHRFTNHLGPRYAAINLVERADWLAQELGFKIACVPTSGEEALADLSNVMRALAEGIHAAGGELILLLDEAQAPILAADSPADANRFAAKLKVIHAECRATSRIAIAAGGSGAITLLNCLRSLPPNGYSFWGAMTRVHLGATPAPEAAKNMAEAIIRARSAAWPEDLKKLITPDYVLMKLSSPIAGSAAAAADTAALSLPQQKPRARPALVAFLAELVGLASAGVGVRKNADAVADAALGELRCKLEEEVSGDAAVALASLDESQRRTIYYIAAGRLSRQGLVRRLGKGPPHRFTELLLTLCEPSNDPDAALALLPPYSALFATILDAEGTLLVEWTGGRWKVNQELQDRLNFFGEYSDYIIKQRRSAAENVSAAVLQAMADDGFGIATGDPASPFRPVASLAEMETLPVFQAIRSVLNLQEGLKLRSGGTKLSPSMETFGNHMAAAADPMSDANKREAASDYASVIGLHVLVWLRRVEAHAYISKGALIDARLTVGVLQHWAHSAIKALKEEGFMLDAQGVPILRPSTSPAAVDL